MESMVTEVEKRIGEVVAMRCKEGLASNNNLSTLKDETINLTLEELEQRWTMMRIQNGIEDLLITESFQRHGSKSFIINGISMEFEDEYVMCEDFSDNGDALLNNLSVLMMFLRESLLNITLLPIGNDRYKEKLDFQDGVVYIEQAA